MLFLVVQEPMQKYRASLVVRLDVVEADSAAKAKRMVKPLNEGSGRHDFKRPYALEIKPGAQFRV